MEKKEREKKMKGTFGIRQKIKKTKTKKQNKKTKTKKQKQKNPKTANKASQMLAILKRAVHRPCSLLPIPQLLLILSSDSIKL